MRIVIVGAGKVGFEIAHRLSQENHDVVLVDEDADALGEASAHLDVLTVAGNGASPRLQEQVAMAEADLLVAVTDSDEVNMVTCFAGKRFGVPTTLARIRNVHYTAPLPYGLPLAALGIDQAINPEGLAALEITRLLQIPYATEVDTFADGQITMVGLNVPAEAAAAGMSLAQLRLRDALVVAIVRDGHVHIPTGDTKLMPGDHLFAAVSTGNLQQLQPLLGKRKRVVRRVAIIGGGRIGTQLAAALGDGKAGQLKVMLFEKNAQRAKDIAQHLPHTLVIHGDGTKIDVLRSEGAAECDAVVLVTGEDHTNLLGTMLAHELDVSQIVTEITREDYVPLARRAGADAVVVPRLLTIGHVLRYVRTRHIVTITLLHEGLAEVVEAVAPGKGPLVGQPLHSIRFPPGAIVGAVMKREHAHIATGNTVIEPGDRVVIFALPDVAGRIERMLQPR